MTEEVIAKRGRGRPKKVVEAQTPVTVESDITPMERAAMQGQIRAQFEALANLAAASGLKIEDMFERPPAAVSQQIYRPTPSVDFDEVAPGVPLTAGHVKEFPRMKLDKEKQITFVPELVPSLAWPVTDEEGRPKLLIDANDHRCWLTVNVPNTVNEFFWRVYKDAVDQHRALEKLKREGPENAPWGRVTSEGKKTWSFKASAATFGMDIDGKFLNTSGQTNPFTGQAPSPAPASPLD